MATMTAEQQVEIDEVWKGYKADPNNKDYRNQLVEHYLPLVKYNGERIWARLPDGVDVQAVCLVGSHSSFSRRLLGVRAVAGKGHLLGTPHAALLVGRVGAGQLRL